MNSFKRPLLKADEVNLNGRMYTQEALKQMVESYKEKIQNGSAFGELGYPSETFTALDNVSHKITDISIEDKTLFGTIEILDTPKGEELKNIIDNVVFRPRLIGHVLEDNTVKIDTLISFDAIDKETDSYKDIL